MAAGLSRSNALRLTLSLNNSQTVGVAMAETIDVELRADTQGLEMALKNLEDRSRQFGSVLTSALKGAVVQGKSLEDTLKGVALSLIGMSLDAALKPLSGLFSSAFSGLLGGILPFAKGGLTGGVQAFADGGIVASPTYFPNGGGIGLMGEAGSEAILPLQRGADGRLGVAAGGGSQRPNVVVNISTPDAQSFLKSQGQVSAMVARAAGRGGRYL
jgi:lambda family phage tail tape measure protein